VDVLVTLLVMCVCLLLEGFFSGSEIGVVSADRIKLRHAAAKGSRGARLALKMLAKPEWLLSTTLVGTNIAVVTNTTVATALTIAWLGEENSWVAVLAVAPLIWVFGEIVPKSVFQQRADAVTPYVIYVLRFFSYLFWPILVIFTFITHLIARLAGNKDQNPFTLREQIQTMLQMPAQEGDIQPVEKTMIRRMFSFSETTVKRIMVPLIDVDAIEQGVTVGEAVRFAVGQSHVRLPVYDGRVDRVVGILNVLDLLGVDENQPIQPFVRTARYVPDSKSISDLLMELRKDGDAVAVVVDEFGGAAGIVTIEDIVEEVVEDIEDEYDRNEEPIQWMKKLGPRDYLVSARTEVDTLADQLKLDLPRGKYATLSGLMLAHTREIPKAGTVLEIRGIKLTVQRSSAQAIQEVRLRW
jgi:putative hemolysin